MTTDTITVGTVTLPAAYALSASLSVLADAARSPRFEAERSDILAAIATLTALRTQLDEIKTDKTVTVLASGNTFTVP